MLLIKQILSRLECPQVMAIAIAIACIGKAEVQAEPIITTDGPSHVEVVQKPDGAWQLERNGQAWVIKGLSVGRNVDHLDLANAIGANTLRNYSTSNPVDDEQIAETLAFMDDVHANGLTLMPGIWLARQDHSWFDYEDPESVQKQRERVRAIVRAYKDHPAILVWGLGNEAENPFAREVFEPFWRELNELAKIIKEEDPNHPVMVTVAGTAKWRIKALKEYCPDVDILGVNAYEAALSLPRELDAAQWHGPVFLGEFGPIGHWEVEKTSWDAPIEQGSEEKALTYTQAWNSVMSDPRGRVIGVGAFLWGQKQEATSTWYGMFLESGEKTPAVDVMAYEYTGEWPKNRCPEIESMESDIAFQEVPQGETYSAEVLAYDREGDPLFYQWQVVGESGERWGRGDKQQALPVVEGCIFPDDDIGDTDADIIKVRTPDEPGAYRLFVYVRDGQGGGAVQNIPFLVTETE